MYFSLLIHSTLGDLVAIANETHLLTLMFADSSGFEKIIEKFGFVIPSEAEGVSIPLVGGSLSKSSYEKKDFLYS